MGTGSSSVVGRFSRSAAARSAAASARAGRGPAEGALTGAAAVVMAVAAAVAAVVMAVAAAVVAVVMAVVAAAAKGRPANGAVEAVGSRARARTAETETDPDRRAGRYVPHYAAACSLISRTQLGEALVEQHAAVESADAQPAGVRT